MNNKGLKPCAVACINKKKECSNGECRLWVDYPIEHNCCLISIHENGNMTLRQIGERIGVSFARVKQIETDALRKMKKNSLLSG
jgi:hypothetical protein